MSSKDHENTWKLLHPELLPRDELLSALRERHVKVDEKIPQEKGQLVELFKRVAMPQAQRSCFKDKTTNMEVENCNKGKPTVSLSKLNSSQTGHQLRQNFFVQGASGFASASSPYNSIAGVVEQLTKVTIKRSASQMNEHCISNGKNPLKREKITWP